VQHLEEAVRLVLVAADLGEYDHELEPSQPLEVFEQVEVHFGLELPVLVVHIVMDFVTLHISVLFALEQLDQPTQQRAPVGPLVSVELLHELEMVEFGDVHLEAFEAGLSRQQALHGPEVEFEQQLFGHLPAKSAIEMSDGGLQQVQRVFKHDSLCEH